MDRNTIVGLVLIAGILIGYTWLTKPSKEEQEAIKRQRDSIALVQQQEQQKIEEEKKITETEKPVERNISSTGNIFSQDSIKEGTTTLENNLIKIIVANQGGMIESVELKDYRTHDSLPLILWQKDNGKLGINFYSKNQTVNTLDYLFQPQTQETKLYATSSEKTLNMRLYAEEGKYIEYSYTISPDSYMIDFNINVVGMDNIISRRQSTLDLFWNAELPQFEKSKTFENRYSGLYYKFYKDEVDYLSQMSDEKEDLATKVRWIAFKQQFFSSVLIANDAFEGVTVESKNTEKEGYLKDLGTKISLPYEGKQTEKYGMKFYFGPNHYITLQKYSEELEKHGDNPELHKLINLGWKWVSWFNRLVVINLFNWLEKHMTGNYGLIILLLTIIIKLVLFPLTYKSYLSSAKMRVLRPQIDAINKKYSSNQAMEKQKATMELYRKAGVNPMGGCIPMLLQMPILIALFYFFPASIELRQESFLWATDLSSYDSIFTLPFTIPFYGDHVSLFCLLMTITNIIYMRMNNKNQPSNDQMKGMQTMMYIMPIMFMFWFNSYASGLSYYYFIATLITVAQTFLIRRFVNDEKLLTKLEAAKKRPVKKSKFQQRLEDMQKQSSQRRK